MRKSHVRKLHRGMMTLTLLLLLSSLLLITMLFNDDLLRLHSALASQRQLYAAQQLALQHLSHAEKQSRCEQLAKDISGDAFLLTFQLDNSQFADGVKHYAWCWRDKLFQKQPVRNKHETLFEQFISEAGLALFREQLHAPPLQSPKNNTPVLYWFEAGANEWEINNNLNAVIVAEGDLHIRGKGKISGSIITKGRLTLDDEIKVTYSKAVTTQLVQQYSRWRLAEKSWHDFVP